MRSILLTLVALAGCANEDLRQRSELQEYRVLAIRADIPQPAPEETVTLSVIEHDPVELDPAAPTGAPFYVWEICPLSLGAIAQYDCLDPFAAAGGSRPQDLPADAAERLAAVIASLAEQGVDLEQLSKAFQSRIIETEGPSLTLDMSTIGGVGVRGLLALCAAVADDGVCRGVDGQPVTIEQGWNVYAKLYSGREGVSRIDSVKVITARDWRGRNVGNPAFDGLIATDADGRSLSGGSAGQAVSLELSLVDGSAETYDAVRIDTSGAVVRDADGVAESDEQTESLLYSWYATGGSLDRARGTDDQRENTFRLPDQPGPVRIWVVARDGRGGFAVRSLDLMVNP